MNIKKVLILLILIFILCSVILTPKVFAVSGVKNAGSNFLASGNNGNGLFNKTKLQAINTKIYNILIALGIGVAVIVGAILGITFIISSAEGKAKISETLVPYIIGCFVMFGAFSIWQMVVNIGNNATGSSNQQNTGTPPATGYVCPTCLHELKNLPASVITGGGDWDCPKCNNKIKPIEPSNIKGYVCPYCYNYLQASTLKPFITGGSTTITCPKCNRNMTPSKTKNFKGITCKKCGVYNFLSEAEYQGLTMAGRAIPCDGGSHNIET